LKDLVSSTTIPPSPDVAVHGPIRVQFEREDLSTALIVTRTGMPQRVLWRSDTEACGAPSISPDGHLVAFICETNGLLVMTLDPLR
jgi:hypothetical protein